MSAPQNTAVSATPPADSAEAPTRLAQIGRWSLMIIGSVAILYIVYFILWQTLATEVFFLGVLIVLLASYFPLSYYSFQQSRAETRKRRIITDGKLLGLTNESEMESLYGEIYAPQQYAIYISMAVVTTVLGFGLYYYAKQDTQILANLISAKGLEVMFYSFLGAYVFSIYYVYRRYITMDLQPNIYLYVAIRMVTAQAIALVAALALESWSGPTPVGTTGGITTNLAYMIPIAAFLIGYIPDTGIRWFSSMGSQVMGHWVTRDEQPLSEINGISLWHETRLRESGIDNVQNLAAADVRDLLLNSRFSTQQLIHWIDQAILMTNLPKKYKQLRARGIITISALHSNLAAVPNELEALLPAAAENDVPAVTLAELQAVNTAIDSNPNFYYVTQYWAANKILRVTEFQQNLDTLLTEQNAQTTTGKVMYEVRAEQIAQMIKQFNLTPENFLALYRNQPAQLVNVGSAYIEQGEYTIAIRILDQAISLNNKFVAAYRARGSAWSQLNNFTEAMADFDRAKSLDPKDPVTFNSLGSACLRQNEYTQAIAAYQEAITLNPTYASAYFNLGVTYSRLGQNEEALGRRDEAMRHFDLAISNFDAAIRCAPEQFQAYQERGAIFMKKEYFPEAVQDFSQAIRYKRSNARSYNDRAVAYLQLKEYWRAVYDLETAIDIDPTTAAYQYNRAQAYWQLKNIPETIKNCTYTIQLNRDYLPAYKLRAKANERQGDIAAALLDIDRYLDKNPPDAAKADEYRQKLLTQQAAQLTPAPEE